MSQYIYDYTCDSIETQTHAFQHSLCPMFVQKIHTAIRYAQFLQSEEQKLHERIWRKKFSQYPDNMTVFEEVGMELQKIEELHTCEVDRHIHNIVRALNAYRVAFGDDRRTRRSRNRWPESCSK
jgi:hypothetical protein